MFKIKNYNGEWITTKNTLQDAQDVVNQHNSVDENGNMPTYGDTYYIEENEETTQSLFINGVEVARIDGDTYYIENITGECLTTVDKKAFIEYMETLKNVCLNTWCEELKKQYIEIMGGLKNE